MDTMIRFFRPGLVTNISLGKVKTFQKPHSKTCSSKGIEEIRINYSDEYAPSSIMQPTFDDLSDIFRFMTNKSIPIESHQYKNRTAMRML